MPRLSLYRPNRTNDYKFFDRTISEMYTVGGLDIYVHKYLGPQVPTNNSDEGDATQPSYSQENPLFIEDLFLLENRDRKYDSDIYVLRGVYNSQDIDFDLSQFGLFLNNDTLFITFHYNDMIDTLGRKLMSGDVIEIPNLRDWHPLDPTTPSLARYYVIQDASYASEGFSQTWLPHLWRVKATPLSNAQEYNDILNKPAVSDPTIWDPGQYWPQGSLVQDGENWYTAQQNVPPGIDISNTDFWQETNPPSISDVSSTREKDYQINDAVLAQAEFEVPLSGYDTVKFYIYPTTENGTPVDVLSDQEASPRGDGYTVGYLTGDGIAPNGLPVTPGVSFPPNPQDGDFCLRLDYFPNRLFRYNGRRWLKIEDSVRTDLTNGPQNKTLRSSFVNNSTTVQTKDRGEIPSRQSLSDLLKPKADNGG